LRLGWLNKTQPAIGLHIRALKNAKHEHTIIDTREIFSIADYMEQVEILSNKYETKTIYLAADIESYYEIIPKDYPQYNFIFHNTEKIKSKTYLSLVTFTSLMFLMETEYLVCTLSSNFAVLAKLLAIANRKPHKEIISLDGYHHRSCELFQQGKIDR